jgi:hypothetical protein
MRRYAVTVAGSVRPGVRQSVIEVEASTNPSGPFANVKVSSGKHRPPSARAPLNEVDSSAPCSHRTEHFSL